MALFLPNPDLLEELMGEDDTIDGLLERVADAADNAKSFAPVATGDYRDSIKAVAASNSVYLVATDWKANFIEFGTKNNPPLAPLRRGLIGAGFELHESLDEG